MQRQDTEVKVKTCTKCGETKPFSEFCKEKKGKYGLMSYCKVCRNKRAKAYRQKNREKIKEQDKAYRQKNREKIKEKKKTYYQENREKVLARCKTYNQENREKVLARCKTYRQENKDYFKTYFKTYYQKNKEKRKVRDKAYRQENKDYFKTYNKTYQQENKDKIKEYMRKKRAEDPLERLKHSIRSRVHKSLKGSKSESTSKILGCSYEQLYLRLGYDNLTNPSHDHIIPLSWGETEEEMLALARWENLQGMELEDNISKGNRYCSIAKANQVLKMHPNPELISKILARAEKKGKNYVQNFGS